MSKDETKPSGLRALFSRRRRKTPEVKEEPKTIPEPTNDSSQSLPADVGATSSARRKYVPRHAARDMVLSMPVEQRPDLVAKAREAQRQNVCSEIGFNTSLRSSDMSIRTVSSQGRYALPLSHHPNLHMNRSVYTDRVLHSRASGSSLRSSRAGVPPMPRTVSTPTPLHQMASISDMEGESSRPYRHRPPPRHVHTDSAASSAAQYEESLNQMLQSMTLSQDDKSSVGSDFTIPTNSGMPGDNRMNALSAPRPPRQYFSHNASLPNLRANPGGKGKERAYGLARHVSTTESAEQSLQSPYESRDAYVIRTQARDLPCRAAGALAPPAASAAPSSNSSAAGSTDSRFNADWSFLAASSTRAESLATAITEQTEFDEEQGDGKRTEAQGVAQENRREGADTQIGPDRDSREHQANVAKT